MIKQTTTPYGALLLRVSLGVMFLAHWQLKFVKFGVPAFVAYFHHLGFPTVMAYAVMILELVGGIALILGIYASWIAVPLAIEMLGTIVFEHGKDGWLFTNNGGGWEYPAFWMIGLVVVYLVGDGALAIKPSVRKRSRTRPLA